jgi:hypothetical protein
MRIAPEWGALVWHECLSPSPSSQLPTASPQPAQGLALYGRPKIEALIDAVILLASGVLFLLRTSSGLAGRPGRASARSEFGEKVCSPADQLFSRQIRYGLASTHKPKGGDDGVRTHDPRVANAVL